MYYTRQATVHVDKFYTLLSISVTTLQAVTWAGAARRIPPQEEQCRRTVYTVQTHWARGAKTRSPYDQ